MLLSDNCWTRAVSEWAPRDVESTKKRPPTPWSDFFTKSFKERYDALLVPRMDGIHWTAVTRRRDTWKDCWHPLGIPEDQRDATMRGRTISPVDMSPCVDNSCYVQINIYDTNIKMLRERGVDFKHILKRIGCRSLIMDVPIPYLNSREFDFGTEANGGKSPDCGVTAESRSKVVSVFHHIL
ncbi:hypothetical protein ANCDUO_17244 [Ancylostoma duodenale]|uniref:Uncharacterized protein n=1 Tax=Ancylostoma duodenale TaxID=51022 RepID=A0A0C2CS78_9BILA|nr:hypothetical protein ANCDUO_17244 [Ancylostoma duodenale]